MILISKKMVLTRVPIRSLSRVTVLEKYEQYILSGAIRNDPLQREIVSVLSDLHAKLLSWAPGSEHPWSISAILKNVCLRAPKGLYIYGDVGTGLLLNCIGCGKTFLMDIFYESCSIKKYLAH